MELDDLKRSWEAHDRKLAESLKMNETLLRQMNLDRAKREMNTPQGWIMGGIVISFVYIVFSLAATLRLAGDPRFLICGIVSTAWFVTFFIFGLRELKLISRIDYFRTPVTELQRSLAQVRQLIATERKVATLTFPIIVVALLPILEKIMLNLNIFAYPKTFVFSVAIGLLIGYPAAIWSYKNFYEKKIRNAEAFIQELADFEQEGQQEPEEPQQQRPESR